MHHPPGNPRTIFVGVLGLAFGIAMLCVLNLLKWILEQRKR
jgi:hypothetical protein